MENRDIELFVLENQGKWELVGELFRQIRGQLNLSQRAISAMIGVSTSVISRFEKGKTIFRRRMVEKSYLTAIEASKLSKLMTLQNMTTPQCLSCDLRR